MVMLNVQLGDQSCLVLRSSTRVCTPTAYSFISFHLVTDNGNDAVIPQRQYSCTGPCGIRQKARFDSNFHIRGNRTRNWNVS